MAELFSSLIELKIYIFGKLKNYMALGPNYKLPKYMPFCPSYILLKIKSKDKARPT